MKLSWACLVLSWASNTPKNAKGNATPKNEDSDNSLLHIHKSIERVHQLAAAVYYLFPVQPIYIKCQNLDNKFAINGRQNQDKELETMTRLRERILIDFPHVKPMFLPTMYVYNIKKDMREREKK